MERMHIHSRVSCEIFRCRRVNDGCQRCCSRRSSTSAYTPIRALLGTNGEGLERVDSVENGRNQAILPNMLEYFSANLQIMNRGSREVCSENCISALGACCRVRRIFSTLSVRTCPRAGL
ncbi:hypothetical protein BQ8794_30321 [Mesorhizobium prunaredense]|uniref:Uncharacterized protein n=1 Tax=Mesorhizobium prunaredense TaxID=1631249 RepID=A0A1R3VDJ0_9HYPH|nr:hypothetical protein BQ8794_30321 [Mesorhizobium prunaredense]